MFSLYYHKRKAHAGFALIASTIVTALLLALGSLFVSSSLTDSHIALAHTSSTQSYYLAQAGVAEFISRLRNDAALFDSFMAGTLTPDSSKITRTSVFSPGDYYEISGLSTEPALAEITALGRVTTSGLPIERRMRLSVARATGSPTTWSQVIAAGGSGGPENGNIDFRGVTSIQGGVIHANRNLQLHRLATVNLTDGDASASGRIVVSSSATLNITRGSRIESAPTLAIPQIDFDSDAPTSWRARATLIMTPDEFDDLPTGSSLSGIIFVDGTPEDLQKNLDVRGVLVINGDFEVEPPANLTIRNHPIGSGLLVKDDLELESNATIHGAVYAGHWLEIDADHNHEDEPITITVTGGLVGFNVRVQPPPGSTITINYNRPAVSTPLDPEFNASAPIVNINHWEEEY